VTLLLLGLFAVSTVRAISIRHMIRVYEDEMLLGNEGSAKSDIDVDADADDAATNKESDTDEVESPKATADIENIVKTARLRRDALKGSTPAVIANTTTATPSLPSAPTVKTATPGNSSIPNKSVPPVNVTRNVTGIGGSGATGISSPGGTGVGGLGTTGKGGPSSTGKGGPSSTGKGSPNSNATNPGGALGTAGSRSSASSASSASNLASSVKDVGVSGTPTTAKLLSKTATAGVTIPAVPATAAPPPPQISYTVNIVAANAKYAASGVASKQA